MISLRLRCSTFWVDVRLNEINRRWIASADTRGCAGWRRGVSEKGAPKTRLIRARAVPPAG